MDVTGEPAFIESMVQNYDEAAKNAGITIINTCGFDSIPADIGLIHHLNSLWNESIKSNKSVGVESFLEIISGTAGVTVNDGTWQSAIYGFANKGELSKLRSSAKSSEKTVVQPAWKLPRKNGFFYDASCKLWSFPFLGSDASVVVLE